MLRLLVWIFRFLSRGLFSRFHVLCLSAWLVICSAWTRSFFAYRCTNMQPSGRRQCYCAGSSRSNSVDSDVEEVNARASFGEPELPLVVGNRAGSDPSGVGIKARIPIRSLASLPLGAAVTLMIAAPRQKGQARWAKARPLACRKKMGSPERRYP